MTEPSGRFRFRRHEHLKKRGDINRVFRKGRSVTCPGAKLFYLDNGLVYNRIAFTFVRKYGNAVERNRAKRLGREAYRLLKDGAKTGYDLILLIYAIPGRDVKTAGQAGRPGLKERMRQLTALIAKAGLG